MAEQKTEDTKPPVARRGARPFVGPAGGTPPARPFVGPAGPTPAARPSFRPGAPSTRPGAAPFAPPVAPERAALGDTRVAPVPPVAPVALTASPAALPQLPAAVARQASPAPPLRPTLPEPAFDITAGIASAATAPVESVEEPARPDASPSALVERPITTETVAVDAFDAAWGPSGAVEAAVTPDAPTLDETSLGSGVDAQHLWADEITAAPENIRPPSNTPPTGHVEDHALEAWTAAFAPDPGIPAWLEDDAEPQPASAPTDVSGVLETEIVAGPAAETVADQSSADEQWPDSLLPDPLLAEYAPYIPTPSSIPSIPPELRGNVSARAPEVPTHPVASEPASVAPVEAAPAPVQETRVQATTPSVDARAQSVAAIVESSTGPESVPTDIALGASHNVRVSAALDRLAERVRGGEIDVSSVAPEAPDAAVLASVLAALLGGRGSRSR